MRSAACIAECMRIQIAKIVRCSGQLCEMLCGNRVINIVIKRKACHLHMFVDYEQNLLMKFRGNVQAFQ